ncbi:MAG: site-2 protease family protein [Candidatus Electryonea clarkiae]|nr:site-2 protease family protein [Candidatus Electryonea clarkiae]MDP8286628.1 site-2 protease family protein [Candidatus Electryonea clarkiae]
MTLQSDWKVIYSIARPEFPQYIVTNKKTITIKLNQDIILNSQVFQFLLLAPSILIGLTLHEFAHGYVAWRLGDPTAKQAGRLTLNPLAHLDFFGTIMLFVAHFGWAKPVPVNPGYFANPKRDMLIVSLAGPAANLCLAIFFSLIIRLIGIEARHDVPIIYAMLYFGVLINISLAVFNMLPIPPLDGSRMIHAVWPDDKEKEYRIFERVSSMVLIGALLLSWIGHVSIIAPILMPIVGFFMKILTGV